MTEKFQEMKNVRLLEKNLNIVVELYKKKRINPITKIVSPTPATNIFLDLKT